MRGCDCGKRCEQAHGEYGCESFDEFIIDTFQHQTPLNSVNNYNFIAERSWSMVKPEFIVKFYGTRGSVPISETGCYEFGGNTTCISLSNNIDEKLIIVDAGTGIRKLGKEIEQSNEEGKEIYLIFTHFHWDHIQGFPFFKPAYNPKNMLNIITMGRDRPVKNIRSLFDFQMQEVYFPVKLDEMGAKMNFLIPDDEIELFGETVVTMRKHDHPGTAYSMRAYWRGNVVVICTDIEHKDKIDPRIVNLARGADLLIHEAQYTEEELKTHRGWGHSSYDQAIEIARKAECKQLVITHHDPDHDDEFLEVMEKKCQEKFENCVFAREGMEIRV